MQIIRLQTQGYKRVTAVDITPDGPVINVRGNNAEGKSSLLDSIKTALGGASVAPVKPIQTGADFAAIRVELGDGKPDLIVEKYFDEVGEKLKVTTAEGAQFSNGQTTVDGLLGHLTFDPLAFAKDPAKQVAELRRLVPLAVDLDQLAAADKVDVAARRDAGRDAKALKVRIDAIPIATGLPEVKPDLDALTATLASAADTNSEIAREKARRDTMRGTATAADERAAAHVATAARLRREADEADQRAEKEDEYAASIRAELEGLPPLGEPVDTTAARTAIDEARGVLERFASNDARGQLVAQHNGLVAKWTTHDNAIKDRAKARAEALASAEMPVPGLALARRCDVIPGDDSEDLIVMFEGEPFEQASSAQQLRVSMRLAMATNPRLKIMLIKDGSLLDPNGIKLVAEMASEGGYQVWMESVGEGDGTGIIMEAGAVRGAPEPAPLDPPKRRKAKAEGDDQSTPAPAATVAESPAQAAPAASPAPAPTEAAPPRRRRALSEFNTPKPGDLFGNES